MTGLLAFDADQHLGNIAPLAIQRGVRIFLPYYKLFSTDDRDAIFAAAKAAGVQVGIVPIFETTATRALGGAVAGATDAVQIKRYIADLRQPAGTAYILTFDFDEQASQDQQCRGYAFAVTQGVPGYPMIAYGNGALAEGLKAQGIAKFAWDAGGMGMRGTRADTQAGAEDMQQDVGDVRGLHLGISIDSDFAPHANSPADLCAWMDPTFAVAAPSPDTAPPASEPAPQQPSPETPSALPSSVEALQTALNAAGFSPGTIDGLRGPNTQSALLDWYNSLGA